MGSQHRADVRDDPREHVRRLACPHPLVNFEAVDPEALLVDEPPAAMGVGDRVEADIAETRLPLANDDRRAID